MWCAVDADSITSSADSPSDQNPWWDRYLDPQVCQPVYLIYSRRVDSQTHSGSSPLWSWEHGTFYLVGDFIVKGFFARDRISLLGNPVNEVDLMEYRELTRVSPVKERLCAHQTSTYTHTSHVGVWLGDIHISLIDTKEEDSVPYGYNISSICFPPGNFTHLMCGSQLQLMLTFEDQSVTSH